MEEYSRHPDHCVYSPMDIMLCWLPPSEPPWSPLFLLPDTMSSILRSRMAVSIAVL